MPRLSVWFVRASLIYLLVGFTFGALMLAEKGIPYYPPIFNLLPIHIELLLIGWLVQLAMGVAIDRFGLFGSQKIALHWPRLAGIALLAAGAALSLRK